VVRILCELVLPGFASDDRLGEFKSLLEKGQAVTPAPAPPGTEGPPRTRHVTAATARGGRMSLAERLPAIRALPRPSR
jgi:hypothetical protein